MLFRSDKRVVAGIAVFGVGSDNTDLGRIDVDQIGAVKMDCLGIVLDEGAPGLKVRGCSQLMGPLATEKAAWRVLEVD